MADPSITGLSPVMRRAGGAQEVRHVCTRIAATARGLTVIGLATLMLAGSTPEAAEGPLPDALVKMAETERAFSARAGQSTIQRAFLEFFADEAVSFAPDPGPARERLQRQPAAPPDLRMVWEPRLGDVSASGDLGYLTGPVETSLPGRPVRYSNYFSVWKRQANGDYRVILDLGSPQPARPAFADGLVRSPAVGSYTGTDSRPAAEATLMAADRAFSAALAASPADAYAGAMHASARLHRPGVLSMSSRTAAVDWVRAQLASMSSEPLKGETAWSRDLGYTWGSYSATTREHATEKGYYLRVWTRRADGTWQLVADVVEPSR